MRLDPSIWPKLHGASTHFPMALAMAAALFDGLGFLLPRPSSSRKAQLHAAGSLTILLGALGAFPAVLSGLFMTKGEVLGHDALRFHHLFVWPAFAGIVGLAVWRSLINDHASGPRFTVYLAALYLLAALMAGAGYWGGELLLNSASASASSPEIPTSPALIAQGRQYFAMSCSHCHGDDARGDEGPDLHNLPISNARIAATIGKGIKDEMPTFAKKYNPAQIAALVTYLRSLN